MATLSVSIDGETETRLEREVAEGDFQSKSELVKRAIVGYLRELAYQRILQSEREYTEGKFFVLRGTMHDRARKAKV